MNKLIERRDAALTELRGLAESEALEGDDLERFETLESEVETLNKRIKVFQTASRPGSVEDGDGPSSGPQYMKRVDPNIDVRTASSIEVRDAAAALLEREHKTQVVPVSDETAGKLEKEFGRLSVTDDGEVQFNGVLLAKRYLITESPAYRSAWQKSLRDTRPAWTSEEVEALNLFRAEQQSLTNDSGGFGVPVHLDPTIIITSGASVAPLLSVARVEPITSSVWKGVASAGVAFTGTAEFVAATADHAELTQPTITPEKAMTYIPYSFEIEGDYPSFATEMQTVIEQAYVDFLAVETATGSAGVIGAFTALDATAGSEVTVTTDGQLGPEDALVVWNDLPERYRSRSAWFMNVTVESQLRTGADGYGSRDLSSEGIGPLLGKRVLLSDYAPSFTGTTGAANLAILADWSRYVVAQRIGMAIELIPNVVDGNGVPTGARAFLAWARVGADFVDDNGGRLLQNT